MLKAVQEEAIAQNHARPLAAALAYYPGCQRPDSPLVTDTLILIGDADDWTLPANCIRWRDLAQTNDHMLAMTVYPGALHSFDAALPPHVYMGHHVGRDPAAAEDAFDLTRRFLAGRLRP